MQYFCVFLWLDLTLFPPPPFSDGCNRDQNTDAYFLVDIREASEFDDPEIAKIEGMLQSADLSVVLPAPLDFATSSPSVTTTCGRARTHTHHGRVGQRADGSAAHIDWHRCLPRHRRKDNGDHLQHRLSGKALRPGEASALTLRWRVCLFRHLLI